jgi:poly(A) polymerase
MQVQDLIRQSGGCSRFVGGCVRDALCGYMSDDLDICTDLTPKQVIQALVQGGVKVIPTGIDHGTVTAVIDKQHYEITTLREDVSTDGRHATVRYTDDWEKDAARRDFTFNALSMDRDGILYDYFGGIDDLTSGYVRFIGEPEIRIEEDYLRILRYFRFVARFAKSDIDEVSLNACGALKHGLKQLSKERITKEILSLLSAETPLAAITLMNNSGVWAELFNCDAKAENLENLLKLQLESPDPILRLGALVAGPHQSLEDAFSRLRFSKRQNLRMQKFWDYQAQKPHHVKTNEQIYRLGRSCYLDRVTLQLASMQTLNAQLLADREFALHWDIPEFPVSGQDLLDKGLAAGPEIRMKLLELEQFWIDENFKPSKDDLLQRY